MKSPLLIEVLLEVHGGLVKSDIKVYKLHAYGSYLRRLKVCMQALMHGMQVKKLCNFLGRKLTPHFLFQPGSFLELGGYVHT